MKIISGFCCFIFLIFYKSSWTSSFEVGSDDYGVIISFFFGCSSEIMSFMISFEFFIYACSFFILLEPLFYYPPELWGELPSRPIYSDISAWFVTLGEFCLIKSRLLELSLSFSRSSSLEIDSFSDSRFPKNDGLYEWDLLGLSEPNLDNISEALFSSPIKFPSNDWLILFLFEKLFGDCFWTDFDMLLNELILLNSLSLSIVISFLIWTSIYLFSNS